MIIILNTVMLRQEGKGVIQDMHTNIHSFKISCFATSGIKLEELQIYLLLNRLPSVNVRPNVRLISGDWDSGLI